MSETREQLNKMIQTVMDSLDDTEELLNIFLKNFKISVYHTRHNDTGYEMCLENSEYEESTYCSLTEDEYNLILKYKKNPKE